MTVSQLLTAYEKATPNSSVMVFDSLSDYFACNSNWKEYEVEQLLMCTAKVAMFNISSSGAIVIAIAD